MPQNHDIVDPRMRRRTADVLSRISRRPAFASGRARAARAGRILAAAVLLLSATPAARATTYYWDGNDVTAGFGAATGTWSAPTVGTLTYGWSTDSAGQTTIAGNSVTTGTADILNFGNGATGLGAGTIAVSGTVSAGDMTFASGSGAIVLSGGTITLAAAETTTVNNATDTINSVLAGAATSFTKAGTGTLILSGASIYTGATIINGGTLQVGNATTGSLNGTNGTALNFTGTGTFNVNEAASSSQGMGLLTLNAGDATIQSTFVGTSAALTFSNVTARSVGATANFVQSGGVNGSTNSIVLTQYNGINTVAGTLIDKGLFFNGSAYATVNAASGFLRAYGVGDTNYLAAPAGTTIGSPTSSSNVDVTGAISAQTAAVANTINMNANSITMSGSSLVLQTNGLLSSGSAGATLGGGTTPRLQPTTSGGEIVVRVNGGSDVLTITSVIQNNTTASSLTKTGAGTLNISAAATFSGGLNINSGTVNYAQNNTLAGTIKIGVGALFQNTSGFGTNTIFSGSVINNGTSLQNANGSVTFNGDISGTGNVTYSSGAGGLVLGGNNSFTGTLSFSGAGGASNNLTLNSNGALGAGTFIFGGGNGVSIGVANWINSNVTAITINANMLVQNNNANFGTGPVTISGATRTVTNASTLEFGGAIGQDVAGRGFTKAGAGTLIFSGSGSNTYSGLTTIAGGTGTLQLAKTGSAQAIAGGGLTIGSANNSAATVQYTGASTDLMGTGAVSLLGQGVLDFNGKTDTIGNVSITATGATAGSTPITNTAGGGNLIIGTLGITPVASFNSVVNSGSGTLTLGGDVTFTAATTGQAQISGNLALGAATRTFTVGLGTGLGQDLLIDAAITGSGGLTKAGTGRLTLSGTNGYIGLTTVTGGILKMTAPSSLGNGGLTVAANQSFIYAPTTAGALNLGSGVLTLGNGTTTSIGTALGGTASQSAITSSGTASLSGTGVVNISFIPGVTATAGTNNLITAAGGLTGGTYTLGTVYNNTGYTVSGFSRSATAVSVSVASATALSGNVFWKGGLTGSTGVWSASNGSTQSNWQSPNGTNQPLVPGATADLVFSATSPGTMAGMTLGANMTVKSLTINDTTTAFGLNADGNTLTITPSSSSTGITMGAGAQGMTIAASVTLGAAQTWTANGTNPSTWLATTGGNVTFGGTPILNNGGNLLTLKSGVFDFTTNSGAGLTVTGAGGLTLDAARVIGTYSGRNTAALNYTGTTTLINGANLLGNLPSGNITLNGGYIESYFGTNVARTLGSGVGQLQILGGVSGFSEQGSSSTVTLNGGASVQWGSAFFNPSALLLQGSTANAGKAITFSNPLDLNGAVRTIEVDKDLASTATISGLLSNSTGTAGLTKTGVGTLILSQANTFNGLTTVSAGVLSLTNASALQNSVLDATNSITGDATNGLKTTPTTLTLGGLSGSKNLAALFTTASGGYTTVTALTLNPGAGVSASYSGGIVNGAATTSLTKTGVGTQILTGANSYSGATIINAGNLTLAVGSGGSLSASSALTMGGGTLQLTGTGNQTLNGLTTTANTNSNILLAANETLTLGALGTVGANSGVNFNTAAGGANGATVGSGVVVLTGALTSGFTVTDTGGFGLATLNGSNQVVRATAGLTLLPATGAVSTIDYRVDNNTGGSAAAGSSSLIVTALEAAKSITVDTTAGNGVLSLNSAVVLSNNTWNFGGTGSNTYNITGSAGSAGLKSVASADTININNNNTGTITFTSPILANGANALIVNGIGTTVLNGANTYTGATTINGGTLQFGSTGSLVAGYNSAITIATGATFRYSNTSTAITLGTVATISGGGGVTIDGGRDFTMQSGGDSYSGPTLVSGNQTRLTSGNVTGSISFNTAITVVGNGSGGGQLYLAIAGTYANNITVSGVGFAEGDAQANFDGAIRIGSTTLSGTITLAGNSRIGVFGGSTNTISGQITGGFGIDFYGMVSANTQVPTFTLSNPNNNYTGNTTIYASQYGTNNPTTTGTTLKLGASNVIPDGASAGNVVFALNGTNSGNSTVTFDLASFSDTINGVTVNAGTFSTKITNTVAGASVLNIGNNTTPSSFNGLVTEGGGGATLALTKIGSNTLTLSGATNAYTGATTISGGILNASTFALVNTVSSIGKGSAGGSAADLVINGGTLQYGGTTAQTTDRLFTIGVNGATLDASGKTLGTLNFTGAGSIAFSSSAVPASLTLTGTGTGTTGAGSLASIIGDSGTGTNITSLTKSGTGAWTLSGPNIYSGGTTLNQGTLTVGTGGTLGATTGSLSVNNNNSTAAGTAAVLNLATTVDTTTGSLSGTIAAPTSGTNTATINNGGNGRNFTVNQTAPGIYAGVIAGGGSFTLGGLSSNTLTISGVNSYTGTTTVSAGTLNVTGSTASGSAVTVSSGAFLTGTGTVGGTVGVTGTISPGTVGTVGALTTGALTLAGTYRDDVTASTTDLITVNGAANFTGGTVNVVGSPATSGMKYKIAGFTSLASNTLPTLTGAPVGYYLQFGGTTELDLSNFTLASAATIPNVTLATIHAGQSFTTQSLSITNNGTALSESLDATVGTLTGTTATGSVSQLPQGQTSNAITGVGLTTTTAGVQSGTVQLNLTSHESNTSLTPQTVTVSGAVTTGLSTWTSGNGTSYSNNANWTDTSTLASPSNQQVHAAPGTFGVTGDTATFGNAGGGSKSVTLDGASPSLAAISFTASDATAYNLTVGSGGSATLDNGISNATITDSSNGVNNIVNLPVTLNSNLAVTVGAGKHLALNGIIFGTGKSVTLTSGSTGELILGGPNTYSGGTTISAGMLTVTSSGNLGTGAVTLNSGALLAAENIADLNHGINVVGNTGNSVSVGSTKLMLINVSHFAVDTVNHIGDSTTALSVGTLGSGFLQLTGSNPTFASAVTVSGGTLGGNAVIGSAVTLTSGGTLTAGNSATSADGAGNVDKLTVATLKISGGSYVWKITSAGATANSSTTLAGQAGTGYDEVVTTSIDLTALNTSTTGGPQVTLGIINRSALEAGVVSLTQPGTEYFQLAAGAVTTAETAAGDGIGGINVSSAFDLSGLNSGNLNGSYAVFAETTGNGLHLVDGSTVGSGLVLAYTAAVPEPVVTGLLGVMVAALVRRPGRPRSPARMIETV